MSALLQRVDAVILAAGQGTRLRSALPKVLHPVAGGAAGGSRAVVGGPALVE